MHIDFRSTENNIWLKQIGKGRPHTVFGLAVAEVNSIRNEPSVVVVVEAMKDSD